MLRIAAGVGLALCMLGAIACQPPPVTVNVTYYAAGVLGGDPERQLTLPGPEGVLAPKPFQQFMAGAFRTSPYANSWSKEKQVYTVLVVINTSGGVGGPYTTSVSPKLDQFHENSDRDAGVASGYLTVAVGQAPSVSARSADDNGNPSQVTLSTGPPAPAPPQRQDPPQATISGLNPAKNACQPRLTAQGGSRGDPGPYVQWWSWDKGPAHDTSRTLVHKFGFFQKVYAVVQDQSSVNLGRPLGVSGAVVCQDSYVT